MAPVFKNLIVTKQFVIWIGIPQLQNFEEYFSALMNAEDMNTKIITKFTSIMNKLALIPPKT